MNSQLENTIQALVLQVRGTVQGVGFRPFTYRLAHRYDLCGWVLNAEEGVTIHVEGPIAKVTAFVEQLQSRPPPAAHIDRLQADSAEVQGFDTFAIRDSTHRSRPTVRISPDLAVCEDCLTELFNPSDRRHGYAYINCTNCGPRYSIIRGLPYDRPQTTMRGWPMCSRCAHEYADPLDRRFHAQPTACPACGPRYFLRLGSQTTAEGCAAIDRAAQMLREGHLLAIKGLGGYHLACDARHEGAVQALRDRKYRKEKPFALMVKNLDTAHGLAQLSDEVESLLSSTTRPIVLVPAQARLAGVSPGNGDLGLMLPYTPLHHLLFDGGAPEVLVMTSANRSSEPIAYRNEDAYTCLDGIAEAFLAGERPIARRVDDSVIRTGPFGPTILRRARGYAPGAVTQLPTARPLLAVGADLKNTVTLLVDGQAFVSQHIGDLKHYDALEAFRETIRDLSAMYEVNEEELLFVHDAHPQYASTRFAVEQPGDHSAVQHHEAHIASVLAERGAWDRRVVGFAFDGTGYGHDGTIWGGEVFVGSVTDGFERAAHLHSAVLPGGDAAARVPVQAAAGFLDAMDKLPDLTAAPFGFPDRYLQARKLVKKEVRVFPTTSMGRLFDVVAALCGFTRPMTFEGQAAIWLEHQARGSSPVNPYPFPHLDYRPLLRAIVVDRCDGRPVPEIARAFHRAVARQVVDLGRVLCDDHDVDTLALSGGVFQNQLLLQEIRSLTKADDLAVWTNSAVPPNDGGISLGQAALAALRTDD